MGLQMDFFCLLFSFHLLHTSNWKGVGGNGTVDHGSYAEYASC